MLSTQALPRTTFFAQRSTQVLLPFISAAGYRQKCPHSDHHAHRKTNGEELHLVSEIVDIHFQKILRNFTRWAFISSFPCEATRTYVTRNQLRVYSHCPAFSHSRNQPCAGAIHMLLKIFSCRRLFYRWREW